MITQTEVEKFIEVSGRAGVLDRHSQIGIAIARELLECRPRIAALEAEREKLREMVMKLANEVDCTNIASLHRRKPLVDQAKALVGGEGK